MNMIFRGRDKKAVVLFVFLCLVFGITSYAYAEESEKTQSDIDFEQDMAEQRQKETNQISNQEFEYDSPEGGIQISPTKFIWTLEPGESNTSKINVKNYSEIEQDITVTVEDFFVGEDGSKPNFYRPEEKPDLKARDIIHWITPPEDFILAPGEAKWVEFKVDVPEGQPTNGYYGGVLFKAGGGSSDNEDSEENGAQIGVSYRVGALVIMAIAGDEPMRIEGELNDFYPKESIFWEPPAILFAEIVNTGNIHYPMFGEIEVEKFGKKFHVIEMRPQLIYPDIPRKYTEKMLFQWWDFGKYTANLAMISEDKSVQINSQTEFWIIPKQGLIIVGSALVVIFIFMWLFKKYVHLGSKPKKEKKTKK